MWRKRPRRAPTARANPLLAVRPEKRILVVVVTADRGLAGGFNSNLIKLAQRFVDEHRASELSFELIGRKARDYFRKRDSADLAGEHLDLFRLVRYEDAERIADTVIERFSKAEDRRGVPVRERVQERDGAEPDRPRACCRSKFRSRRRRWITSTNSSPRKCWAACCRAM